MSELITTSDQTKSLSRIIMYIFIGLKLYVPNEPLNLYLPISLTSLPSLSLCTAAHQRLNKRPVFAACLRPGCI